MELVENTRGKVKNRIPQSVYLIKYHKKAQWLGRIMNILL